MEDVLRAVASGLLAVGAVVLAAKAHGRQVRLRREAEGVMAVDFRGTNPPAVQDIWRRDRAGFWSVFIASAAGYAGLATAGVLPTEPRVLAGLLGLAAAFVDAFLFMAVWWAYDLRRAHGQARFGWGWALGAAAALAAAVALALG